MPDATETPPSAASTPASSVQINENGIVVRDGKDVVRINLHGVQVTSGDASDDSNDAPADAAQSSAMVGEVEASPAAKLPASTEDNGIQSVGLMIGAALLILCCIALIIRLRRREPQTAKPPKAPAGGEIRISKPGKEVHITPEAIVISKADKTVRIVPPGAPETAAAGIPEPPPPPPPPEAAQAAPPSPTAASAEAADPQVQLPGLLAVFLVAALFIRLLVQQWHIPGWYATVLQGLLAISLLWMQTGPTHDFGLLQEQWRRVWNYCAAWLVAVRWQRLLGFSVCAWLAVDALGTALFIRFSIGNAMLGLVMSFVCWRIAAKVPVQLPRQAGWANVRRFRPLEMLLLVACFCLAVLIWPQKDRTPPEPWSFHISTPEQSGNDSAEAADRQAREAEREARIAERKAERHAKQAERDEAEFSSAMAFFGLFLALLAAKLLAGDKIKAEEAADTARNDADMAALQREAADARVAAMQAQIEPHFLFNTLASIDQLIQTDPARASHVQKNLIRYLREAVPQIREDAQRSTLGKQLAMSRAYVEIMQMRMEERLQAEFHISDGLHAAEFPSMMLQTLIENAIKHGLEPRPEGGRLIVSAEVGRNQLIVKVEDNGMGCDPARASDGTGLANVRERLRLLYGERAVFSLQSREGGGAIARIQLPYIDEAPPVAPAQG